MLQPLAPHQTSNDVTGTHSGPSGPRRRSKPPGFQVIAGDDAFIAPTILMGGVGAITASAHVRTNLFAGMIDAARTGSSDTVMTLANALLPVVTTGFAEPNPACWKAALHPAGQIATATLRLPMYQASDAATQTLLETISDAHHLPSALSP